MCLRVCISLVFLLTLADGFFLPVFVRKQHPLSSPALGYSPQSWSPAATGASSAAAAYHSSVSAAPSASVLASATGQQVSTAALTGVHGYKEYNPYSSQQVQQVQASPQYGYESGATPYQMGSYPQYHSAFQSVQLVPCLCPLSKDIIEQQSHQYHNPQGVPLTSGSSQTLSSSLSSSSSLSPVAETSNANDVLVKGGQKVGS